MTDSQPPATPWSRYAEVDTATDPAAFVRHMDTLGGLDAILAYKHKTFSLLEIIPGMHLLDAGCGPGTDAQQMAEMVGADGYVVGVDKSETMIVAAQKRTQGLGLPLAYRTGDLYDLEFADNSFDGCRADRVFHHLKYPEIALAELARVARPGARIVIAEPDFNSIVLDSPDKEVTRKVLDQRSDLYPNGWCGRQLPGLFRRQGLTDLIILPKILMFYDFDFVNTQLLGLQNAAEIAQAAGRLTRQQVARWLEQLEKASNEGLFFLTATIYIVSGRKCG